ncbi:hypothetical protein ACFWFB_32085, partial [Streptomyces albidoflavus]
AVPFLSQEFGGESATAGKTPAFSQLKRKVFDGGASNGLVLNIECWEWDTGDGNDDSISEALTRLNNNVLSNIIWSVAVEVSGSALLGYLSDIASIAITFLELLARNDLSCRRTLFLDRYDLALLERDGTTSWHFNGDGYHELRVKYTALSPVTFPAGTLEYVVHN